MRDHRTSILQALLSQAAEQDTELLAAAWKGLSSLTSMIELHSEAQLSLHACLKLFRLWGRLKKSSSRHCKGRSCFIHAPRSRSIAGRRWPTSAYSWAKCQTRRGKRCKGGFGWVCDYVTCTFSAQVTSTVNTAVSRWNYEPIGGAERGYFPFERLKILSIYKQADALMASANIPILCFTLSFLSWMHHGLELSKLWTHSNKITVPKCLGRVSAWAIRVESLFIDRN